MLNLLELNLIILISSLSYQHSSGIKNLPCVYFFSLHLIVFCQCDGKQSVFEERGATAVFFRGCIPTQLCLELRWLNRQCLRISCKHCGFWQDGGSKGQIKWTACIKAVKWDYMKLNVCQFTSRCLHAGAIPARGHRRRFVQRVDVVKDFLTWRLLSLADGGPNIKTVQTSALEDERKSKGHRSGNERLCTVCSLRTFVNVC